MYICNDLNGQQNIKAYEMKMCCNFQHDKTHNFKFITNIPMSPIGHLYQTLNYFKIITMGTNFIYIVEHVETH